jgi:7-cyano-7-deazaguanine synthase
MKTALLLSGGLDSTALAYWKRPDIALTLDYGQICAEAEVRASKQVCADLQLPHEILSVDCRELGSGDLAGSVPHALAPSSEWWPFRNQLLITLAAMRAVTMSVSELLVASVQSDGSHADGREEFFDAIDRVLQLQEGGLRVSAPAIRMTSSELIRASGIPGSILCWAHSCHTSSFSCGNCRGCFKHDAVMKEIGLDPY